mgnify:CR=1 FL=1
MKLTPDQKLAVTAPGSAAVTAGAGTGKTHMLTERYLHHLREHGLRPLEMVAATFTEAAAAELRGRIRSRLRGDDDLAGYAEEIEAAQIGTLHSLASRICREHPDEARVPYNFRVLDDLEARLWQTPILREHLATESEPLPAALEFTTLTGALRELLDDRFTAQQALALDPREWPERLEQQKLEAAANLRTDPDWLEAVEFIRRVAADPSDKLEVMRSQVAAAVEQLHQGRVDAEVCKVIDGIKLTGGGKKAWGSQEMVAEVRQALGMIRDLFRAQGVLTLFPSEADEALAKAHSYLKRSYYALLERLEEAKRRERVLNFEDLELGALRALEHAGVRSYYRARWRAYLIDEFQDTSPVQAQLLEALTGMPLRGNAGRQEEEPALLTVVGDEKQSIYGFRRADVSIFQAARAVITAGGGTEVSLATSFRTHQQLTAKLNTVVAPALKELHQDLQGARPDGPGEGPHLSVHLVTGGPAAAQSRLAEAHVLGELIEGMLERGDPVFDKEREEYRPVQPGDIAILSGSWNALAPYGDELAARGINVVQVGGGQLLEQREVQDGLALLRFLANPTDNLAFAAVLRSPFFALSDSSLHDLATAAGDDGRKHGWWHSLNTRPALDVDGWQRVRQVITELLGQTQILTPTELLHLADDLTGYTAVIANLPGGGRRVADWNGLLELIEGLQLGSGDLFAVVRELDAITALEDAKLPRPGIEAGNAVSLLSIHKSKGLEWPVVILPNITGHRGRGKSQASYFDARFGVAVKVWDGSTDPQEPTLLTFLKQRNKVREDEEHARLLYVALTRARDRVIITGNSERGSSLEKLRRGLEDAGVVFDTTPFDPANAVPKLPRVQEEDAQAGSRETLIGEVGPGIFEVPASSLATYRYCPRRFDFEHLQQHPGAGDGLKLATRTGTLAHKALQYELTDVQELAAHDRTLPVEHVRTALELAQTYRTSSAYAGVRQRPVRHRELPVAAEANGVRVGGVADAVGSDFILDYKTGERDEGHTLQVAAYARALGKTRAYIAYLKTEELSELDEAGIEAAWEQVRTVPARMRDGDLAATPSPEKCSRCPFSRICKDSQARGSGQEALLV